ncbi:MAG: hypothetical protein JXA99_01250 [Candidatus Lokiarchaeota archaeon]|nr:hypothetical protein [Candidatus Lokiarchaeota archaeon]
MSDNLEDKIKKVSKDLIGLIEKQLEEYHALLGIAIGTHGGTFIASNFKKQIKMKDHEIAAANSSILFLSSKLLKNSLNQDISYDLITGKLRIILSIITNNITLIAFLNRELAELEGVNKYISKLKEFALKISAIVETSEIIKEEVFVGLKRAIPNALVTAIITKDGLPVKVQSTMAEPMLSALLAAFYKLSGVILENSDLEYSIIGGENGSIIVHELDETRVLCVAVPESDEKKLGAYIAEIKTILDKDLTRK